MFFRLLSHCRLVEGAFRAAIYDLNSGKVLSVNGGAADLLIACQARSVEDVLAELPNAAVFQTFLNTLVEKQLGSFYMVEPATRADDPLIAPPKLEFVWLELTAKCNNRCLHCYSESHMNCEETTVPHERWLKLLEEAHAEGATGIQLIGGEPLLYPQWRDLVEKASSLEYEYIEIFTNATLVRESDIEFFKRHQVRVATTIYADNAAIHDTVTKNPGSFERTLSAARSIVAAGIPLRIASIIMKPNEGEVENIMRLCEELGVESGPPDVVRPTGRGDDEALLPETYCRLPVQPPFAVDPDAFFQAQRVNPCLAGKIAVTAAGDVIPCIFARSMVCGNILHTSLRDVLTGAPLKECWHTTRDCVEKCGDCEYRYACHDCRPLAQGADQNKNWLAASPGCSYNPYTGKWEDLHE
ncbi:MAG: Radical domain protein [Anaerosporomusa subterranea]|jgi:radical SAM protein with 4Fe4S-binding SPASM domain|nr:Radical domain protein [Anaerosporomusa subterranea]